MPCGDVHRERDDAQGNRLAPPAGKRHGSLKLMLERPASSSQADYRLPQEVVLEMDCVRWPVSLWILLTLHQEFRSLTILSEPWRFGMTKPQYVGKVSAGFIYLTVTMFWLIPAFGQTTSTALRFTADGQQVLIPHTDELDRINLGLTIESWVKPDASLLSRGYSSIVSKQLNGTGYMTASNMLGPEPGFKAEVAGIQVTSQSRPVAGIWQHIAAVWDHFGQLKIYVNGQLNGVINADPPIPNTFPLWIGSSPFGADTNFRGDIDEVRIWAVARSQEEIQSTMNQYLCGDEIGLRAYWSFDEGSGQQVIDTLGRSNGSISGPVWVPGVQLSRRPCPQVSFVGAKTFPAGTNPRASVVGDFNRDGNKDLAVANSGSNDVSVLLGNGDGTFQPPVNFPVGGSPNSIVMDYFNGDSIQDLAVANGNSISVLLGNGNGTFQPALNFPAGPGASSIDRGDFNGDHRTGSDRQDEYRHRSTPRQWKRHIPGSP